MTDPSAILPIVLVVAATMLAGILCNLGIWFVVIRFLRGLASRMGVHVYLAVRQLGGRRSGYVSATALVAMWGISASSCNLITTLSVMGVVILVIAVAGVGLGLLRRSSRSYVGAEFESGA